MKISRLVADRPADALTGAEGLPVIQAGSTKGASMAQVTQAARAPIAAELDAGASAYGSWLQLPGNAGRSVAEYLASLKGDPGIQGNIGPAGPAGADGLGASLYTWFAYADNATGTAGFTTGIPTGQSYIGVASNRLTPTPSTTPGDYTWSRILGPQGPQGAAGPQGNDLFTWIAYANNANGTSGFTTGAWAGQTYIGIANNKTTSVEGSDPAAYVWSLIRGDAGVPGSPGADGATTYTWFAYANSADGSSGFTNGAWSGQTYLGISANRSTPVESGNYADYTWSLIKGADGAPGSPGATGPQGPAGPPGTSPSASFPAVKIGLTTTNYGSPIVLESGQSINVAGFLDGINPTGGGTLQLQLQMSVADAGAWNTIASGSGSATYAAGEPTSIDIVGTFTNSSGQRQSYDLRAVGSKTGAGAITASSRSYMRPGG